MYLQGGTGSKGFESENKLVDSKILLILLNGEHLGSGTKALELTSRHPTKINLMTTMLL